MLTVDMVLCERLDGLRTAGLGTGEFDLLAEMESASAADPRLPARPDDVIIALYTSGTTGTLKAAQHTQASYAAIVANILSNLISPGRDDVMLHAAPLIHASGTFVLPFWLRGGQAEVLGGFDPEAYAEAIHRSGATHANLVPTMLQMLLSTKGATAGPGRLRSVIYGASPTPRPVIERLAGYKVPKRVEFIASVPKSAVGKILRRELRDPLWAGVERAR